VDGLLAHITLLGSFPVCLLFIQSFGRVDFATLLGPFLCAEYCLSNLLDALILLKLRGRNGAGTLRRAVCHGEAKKGEKESRSQ
jgi:hypothetical protein